MRARWLPYFLAVVVCGALLLLFPKAVALVELAAREIMYLWWIVLLVTLAIFLIWGFGRKNLK